MASPAVAGGGGGGVHGRPCWGVTVGVASPAVAGVASPAIDGAASPADLAGGVTVGVAFLANAGVASLADLADSVAGRVMCLTIPVGVGSDGATCLKECDVWSRSVFL